MFGRGDRTTTAPQEAAGEQTPAITAQKSKSIADSPRAAHLTAWSKHKLRIRPQQATPPSPTARLSAARLDPRKLGNADHDRSPTCPIT